MTADELLLQYSDWVAANNAQHNTASLAAFVVEVVIPRECSKFGEGLFNDGYTEGYNNGRTDVLDEQLDRVHKDLVKPDVTVTTVEGVVKGITILH